MDAINDFFSLFSQLLWGWPMIVLLLGTHVFLTIRLRVPQRRLLTGIRMSVSKDKGATGDSLAHSSPPWQPPSARATSWVWPRL